MADRKQRSGRRECFKSINGKLNDRNAVITVDGIACLSFTVSGVETAILAAADRSYSQSIRLGDCA